MLLGRLQCWPPHRLLRWEPLGRDRHGRVYWLLDGAGPARGAVWGQADGGG